MVWNHQAYFLSINSLEDVIGGNAVLSFFVIIGGAFNIATKNFGADIEFKGKGLVSAESSLSY